MRKFHDHRFPGENGEYRQARNELLAMEIDLRKRIEEVAALRRTLPLGGKLQEDYVFDEGATDLSDQQTVKQTRLSELFEKGKNSLIIYSFMYAPEAENACPMCTSILDGLNGNSPHVNNRVNFAVVAKAPIQKIRSWALSRGWKNLRLLSSLKNTYNADYFAESSEGSQLPALNVFQKTAEGIYHFYNTELLYVPPEKGQNPRHVDLVWPLWNLFDLTSEGRGTDWFPKFSYD
ncbi:DUF899 family protein [candidate division KSB1 bacterium]|nr:DUF899 family protein [candidate division KSB1 bacterium]